MTLLTLRDYQEDALDRIAKREADGVRRQLGQAATGLGKAQPVDEPVLTPWGWVPMGSLRPGDQVIGSDGKPTTVTGVFPQGRRPIVTVRFSDGATVRCDRDHLWTVRDKHDVHRGRPWRVLQASELSARWRVPLVGPVEFGSWIQPLDPYLLGVLLGDGGLSVRGRVLLHTEHALAATLHLPHPATLTKLRDDGPNGIGGTYIIGGPTGRGRNPVLSALRDMGLEGRRASDKRVPASYLYCTTAADRLDLLRGIMDADGHVRADGHVELTLANEGLAGDVVDLVRSLGGTARLHPKRTTWTHAGEHRSGVAWRVSVALDVCPFRWKADRWKPRTKYHPMRQVVSVTPEGTAECVCISVDAHDQLYVTNDYVLTHNTVIFCALAERRGCRTLILAHRDELVSQAVAKVKEIWPGIEPGIVKAADNHVHSHVVVGSVQTLSRPKRLAQLVASQEPNPMVRAEPFGLVVVDEAHHAAADSYRTILAGLRAGEDDGPLLLGVTATPDRGDGKGLDDLFDEIVFTYDILWGIRSGYLSDLRGLLVKLEQLDLSRVKVTAGDYNVGQAGAAMEEAGAPSHIVRAWSIHARDRRTLVFTPTVQLAADTAHEFQSKGVACDWISGETPLDERRRKLERFQSGDCQVMVNCFDAETEILTATGWKGPDEIAEGNLTAAVDPETGRLRWEPASRVVRRARAVGERMVHIRNQTLDLRVTEGHRMLWRPPRSPWRITEASVLPDRGPKYEFRIAAHGSHPGVPLTHSDLAFLGLFATDGCLSRSQILIAQSATSPTCAMIESILTGCGFDWKVNDWTGRTPAGDERPYRTYRVPKGSIGGQLARNGWERLAAWLDKSLSDGLGACTPDQYRSLLYGCWVGDGLKEKTRGGPHRSWTICGADQLMLDRLQTWAVLRGMGASQSWRPNGPDGVLGYVTVRDRDTVGTNNAGIATSGGNPARFDSGDRCEEVWCVTNETGTVLARRRGRVMVVGQCAVLTEGYDNPAVDCIVVARPTKSRALYSQMVGRGTRRHPGKADCLVLDIVGATDEHSLLTIPSLFGIDAKEMKKGLSVVQAVEEREAEQVRLGQITAHEAELFKQVRAQALAWVKAGQDFALSFGRYNLYLRPDPASGLWTALALKYQGKDAAGRRIPDRTKVFIADVSLEIAQGVAEDFVRTRAREDRNEHIVDANAEWRGRKPTRKQLGMAQRLRIKVEPAMTAGDLSDQITAKLAERRARRVEL